MGIEPTPSAWKAEVLPLNYTRMEGAGFEPAKAKPSDLQSDPFDRSGTPPDTLINFLKLLSICQQIFLYSLALIQPPSKKSLFKAEHLTIISP